MPLDQGGEADPITERIEQVTALRRDLWAAGFRPVPVYNHDNAGPSPGKRPMGDGWQLDARRSPPLCADGRAVRAALNTGILCDGLRAVDIDVDDQEMVAEIWSLCTETLGETIMRYRADSPRVLLVYRAVTGEPVKRVVKSPVGKVEILGKGQQFVGFGFHPDTGAELQWKPEAPGRVEVTGLSAVTEEQVNEFLRRVGEIIGAQADAARSDWPGSSASGEALRKARIGAGEELSLIEDILWAENYHGSQMRLIGLWQRRGMTEEAMLDEMFRIFDDVPTEKQDKRYRERYEDIPRCIHDIFKKEDKKDPAEREAGLSKWAKVNWAALANLDAWVPVAFPEAERTDHGGWRIGAAALGRDDGDLDFAASGIRDFGKKRTLPPLDVLKEYLHGAAVGDAALWLCAQLGVNAIELGFDTPKARKAQAAIPDEDPGLTFDEEAWIEADIPKRPWIVPKYLLRRAVTVIAGVPAGGKSSLAVSWGCSLATGTPFSDFEPVQPCRVLVYNCEDDKDEQRRRFSAALRQSGHTPADLVGQVVRVGVEKIGTLFGERYTSEGSALGFGPLAAMKKLEERIEAFRPDVIILDPLVELHDRDENSNVELKRVVGEFRALAVKYDAAVVLLHHVRKGSGSAAGDMDSIRGGGAIPAAARLAFTLTKMSDEDATLYGISDQNRRHYLRLDEAKANYSEVPTDWLQKHAYMLDNGEAVMALQPWDTPVDVVKPETRAQIESEVALGSSVGPWSVKLSGDARSVRSLLLKHGVATAPGQRGVVKGLEAAGFTVQEFRRANGSPAQGLRSPDGRPAAKWVSEDESK